MADQRNMLPWRKSDAAGQGHQHTVVKGREKERYWPGTLMGLGIFIALGSALTVMPWTLIASDLLLRILLGLCFVGNFLPLLRRGDRFGMARLEWFLFNLIAVGPIATSLLLWANFLFHGPATTTEHAVKDVERNRSLTYYEFTDGTLEEFPFARATYSDWFPIVGNTMRITQAEGAFGIPVVVKKEPFVR